MATRGQRREAQDAQRNCKTLERMDPAVATTILLARHGETDWNAERRLQGQQDPELNAEGREQAAELAASVQAMDFDALYSSDLRRAVQTAEAIAARRPASAGMQVVTSPHLRERSLGVLEGLTLREAAAQQPEAFRLLRASDEAIAVPGGESPQAMQARVVREVEHIAALHSGKTILIVAHGGVIHAIYRHTCGHSFNGPISNASLHRIRVQGALWAILEWNMQRPQAHAAGDFGGGIGEG